MAKSTYERIRIVVDREAPGSVIEQYSVNKGVLWDNVTIQTKGPGQTRTTIVISLHEDGYTIRQIIRREA